MPFVLAIIGAFVVAWLIALATNWFGLYRWGKRKDAHWTEHARSLYPVRRSAGLNVTLIAALCGLSAWEFVPANHDVPSIASVAVAGWFGAYLGMYPLVKRLFPQFTFGGWLKYVLAIRLLQFGVLAVLILAAVIMPDEFGWQTIVLAGAVLGFQIALHYGLWFWMGSKVGVFKRVEDSERVAGIVRQTSERMKISYHSVWKLQSPMGYAAAMPLQQDLIFSEGLLEKHPDNEVAAICAHELAHLNEPRSIHRLRLISSLGYFPFIFTRPVVHMFGPMGLSLLWMPMAFLGIYTRQLGRKMEVRADSAASEREEFKGVYAQALERLYRDNQLPAVMPGQRQVHPHLYDRLLAAGVTPDYPRPKAPELLIWTSGFIIFALVVLFVAILCEQSIP